MANNIRDKCIVTTASTDGCFRVVLENSGNFGWNVNGKRLLGSSNWKTPEIYGSSEKVVLFSRLERFEWISLFHLHVPRFSHQFQVIDDFSSHDQAPLRRSVKK